MHLSATEIPDGARLDADVCVVGAGPAGIAVALELEARNLDAVLIEQGTADLRGEVHGVYPTLEKTRAGGFGGSAALWDAELADHMHGARHGRLSPSDFEPREGAEWSGWPFDAAELDSWYDRAAEICELVPAPAGTANPRGRLVDHVLGFSPASTFLETHRRRLVASRRVRVIEPATALSLSVDENRVAHALEVSTAPGQRIAVHARTFVLALGGIENARFLLLNDLGNEHDLVGRFFMDHPTAHCRLSAEPASDLAPYDVQVRAGRTVAIRALGLADDTRTGSGLGNSAMFIVPRLDRDERVVSAASQLLGRSRTNSARMGVLVRRVALAPDVLLFESYRRLSRRIPALAVADRVSARARLRNTLAVGTTSGWSQLRRRPTAFEVHHAFEQFPDYERRITLGERRDSLGRPVPKLGFFISDAEIASLERTQEIIRAELRDLGVGTLSTTRDLVAPHDIRESIHPSAHHHLGTTRMHVDPRRGVVDADGRLHAGRNIYVTGGSVFPTGGYVNPTLTIVALAARLGVHLADRLEGA